MWPGWARKKWRPEERWMEEFRCREYAGRSLERGALEFKPPTQEFSEERATDYYLMSISCSRES